jgi:hypothetical protein
LQSDPGQRRLLADGLIEDAILQTYAPPQLKQGDLQVGQEGGPQQQVGKQGSAVHTQQVKQPGSDHTETPSHPRQQQQQLLQRLQGQRRVIQQAQTPDERRQQAQQQEGQQQAVRQALTPDERRQQAVQQRQRQRLQVLEQQQDQQQEQGGQAHDEETRRQLAQAEEEAVRRQQAAQDGALRAGEAARAAAAAQRERAAHEAAHAELLEKQRRQAVAQSERLAANQEGARQQASLGRGSLRQRKQAAAQQAPVTRSRAGDIFAERTEQRLAEMRQQLEQRRAEQAILRQQLEAAALQIGGSGSAGLAGIGAGLAGIDGLAQAKAAGIAAAGVKAAAAAAGSKAAGALGARAAGAASGGDGDGERPRIPLLIVVVMTLVMAAAAGLGALPFFCVRKLSDGATGLATAVACGVMLAASFDLVHEGESAGSGGQWNQPDVLMGNVAVLDSNLWLTAACHPLNLMSSGHVVLCRPALRPHPRGGRTAGRRRLHPLGAAALGGLRGH